MTPNVDSILPIGHSGLLKEWFTQMLPWTKSRRYSA